MRGHAFWFISREAFLKLVAELPDRKGLPPHQTLLESNVLVRKVVTEEDVALGRLKEDHACISYRWTSQTHPDPEGKKARKIGDVLEKRPHVKFLWVDWLCVPQKYDHSGVEVGRSSTERQYFDFTLEKILVYLYLSTKVIVLWDLDFNRRFWPCVETWTAMQHASPQGVRPATDVESRAIFVNFAEDDDDVAAAAMKRMWLHRAPEEAADRLACDDINVTSRKDKETNIAIVRGINRQVKSIFRSPSQEAVRGRKVEAQEGQSLPAAHSVLLAHQLAAKTFRLVEDITCLAFSMWLLGQFKANPRGHRARH